MGAIDLDKFFLGILIENLPLELAFGYPTMGIMIYMFVIIKTWAHAVLLRCFTVFYVRRLGYLRLTLEAWVVAYKVRLLQGLET